MDYASTASSTPAAIKDSATQGSGKTGVKNEGGEELGKGGRKEDEIKARNIEAINSRIEGLSAELVAAKERLSVGTAKLKNPAAATVKQHIHLLHEYNEIRDIGQGLIGMIADNRGVRISDVYEEFGVGLND